MKQLRLLIEGNEVELTNNIKFAITKQFEDIDNPSNIKNNWSKSVSIPFSKANNKIFGNAFQFDRVIASGSDTNAGIYFDPNKKANFLLFMDSELLMSGYAKLDEIKYGEKSGTYNITLNGELGRLFQEMKKISFIPAKDEAEYTIDASKYIYGTIGRDLIYDAWNKDDAFGDIWLSGVTSPLDIINFGANLSKVSKYKYDSFINNSGGTTSLDEYLASKTAFSSFGVKGSDVYPKGLLPRDARQFRSYHQIPVIWFHKLFQIFQEKAEEVTGYKFKLDPSWFTIGNQYWSYMGVVLGWYYDKNLTESGLDIGGGSGGTGTNQYDQELMYPDCYNIPTCYKSKFAPGGCHRTSEAHYSSYERPAGYLRIKNPREWFQIYHDHMQGGEFDLTGFTDTTFTFNITCTFEFHGYGYSPGDSFYFIADKANTNNYNGARLLDKRRYCDGSMFKISMYKFNTTQILRTFRIWFGANPGSDFPWTDFFEAAPDQIVDMSNQRIWLDGNCYGEVKASYIYQITTNSSEKFSFRFENLGGVPRYCDVKNALNTIYFVKGADCPIINGNVTYPQLIKDYDETLFKSASKHPEIRDYLDVSLTLSTTKGGSESTGRELIMGGLWNNDFTILETILKWCKMVGVLISVDEKEKTINFIHRSTYFKNYTITDWSEKIVKSKGITVKQLKPENRYLRFSGSDKDNDAIVGETYNKKYGVNYGGITLNTGNEFNTESKNFIEDLRFISDYSPNVRRLADVETGNFIYKHPAEVYACNFNEDFDTVDLFGSFCFINPKYRFFNGVNTESVYITDDSSYEKNFAINCHHLPDYADARKATRYFTTLSIFSNTNFSSVIDHPVCTFTMPKEINVRPQRGLVIGENKGMYDAYWRNYFKGIYDKDNKIVTCYVRLTEKEFYEYQPNKFVRIGTQVFLLNKIIDFEPGQNSPTKVELLTIQNPVNYYKLEKYDDYGTLLITPGIYEVNYHTGGTVGIVINSSSPWVCHLTAGVSAYGPTYGEAGISNTTLSVGSGYPGTSTNVVFTNEDGVSATFSFIFKDDDDNDNSVGGEE